MPIKKLPNNYKSNLVKEDLRIKKEVLANEFLLLSECQNILCL